MTPAERHYRRALRLLPVGYRQQWEEDMVSAYMDSVASSPRRSVGEWLAVAWLALRLRLNGSHATPRAQLWYQLVLGIAMLTTLYQSVNATILVADSVWSYFQLGEDGSWPDFVHAGIWRPALSLAWVATFVCLVVGRRGAARALLLVALVYEIAMHPLMWTVSAAPDRSSATFVIDNENWTAIESVVSHWWWGWYVDLAWLCLAAVTVFLVPNNVRPSRRWLAAYLAPVVVILPIALASTVTSPYEPVPHWLQLLQLLNVGTLLHFGTIVGLVVALLRVPRWRLPLALFGGAVAAGQLLGHYYGSDTLYNLRGGPFWTWVNAVQLALALACAVAGFVAVWRAGTPAANLRGEVDPAR